MVKMSVNYLKISLAEIRNNQISLCFQAFNFLPQGRQRLKNVALPMTLGGTDERIKKAQELLKEVGLEDRMGHTSSRFPRKCKGGNARALSMNPRRLFWRYGGRPVYCREHHV